jgi:Fe-S-cluster containining protein
MKHVELLPAWSKQHPGRTCGSCHACCIYLGIEELKKYAGQTCKHLSGGPDPSKRCMIYDRRPTACSGYKCAWIDGLGPDWMKPHDCGILITLYPSEVDKGKPSATINIFDAKKYKSEYIDEITEQMILLGISELRIINYPRRIGLFYHGGSIYRCRLVPTSKGNYEGLMFEALEPPVGHYMVQDEASPLPTP